MVYSIFTNIFFPLQDKYQKKDIRFDPCLDFFFFFKPEKHLKLRLFENIVLNWCYRELWNSKFQTPKM